MLKNGRSLSVNAVEAINPSNGIVQIKATILQRKDRSISPKVHVIQELDGFQCQIKRVEKIKTSSLGKNANEETYIISVTWAPGKDWSSCAIEVVHPSLDKSGVVLYINGDYSPANNYDPYDY